MFGMPIRSVIEPRELVVAPPEATVGEATRLMKRGSRVVVQADNLPGRVFTPLVRDFGTAIGEVLRADAEIVVAFDGGPKDFLHTHCLVFRVV